MKPLAYPRHALDFDARTPAVTPGSAPRWAYTALEPPPRTRLLALGDGLVLVDDERFVVEVNAMDPDSAVPARSFLRWRRHALDLADVGPGLETGPLLVARDGLIYRWLPGEDPQPVYQAGTGSVAVAVTGLPGDRLLLQRYEPGTPETLLVDPNSGQGSWRHAATVPFPMVDGQRIYFRPLASPGGLFACDLESGEIEWRLEAVPGGLGEVIGCVGGVIWLSTRRGQLLALEARSGEPAPAVDVPATAHPRGVLDGQGRLHVCNSASYHLFDMVHGGRLLASHRWPQTERGPGMVLPGAVLPAAGGRLFFGDDRGGLYVSEPGDPARPVLLWQAPAPLVTLGADRGRLVILDTSGVLHVL